MSAGEHTQRCQPPLHAQQRIDRKFKRTSFCQKPPVELLNTTGRAQAGPRAPWANSTTAVASEFMRHQIRGGPLAGFPGSYRVCLRLFADQGALALRPAGQMVWARPGTASRDLLWWKAWMLAMGAAVQRIISLQHCTNSLRLNRTSAPWLAATTARARGRGVGCWRTPDPHTVASRSKVLRGKSKP